LRVHDEWTLLPRISAFHGIVITMYFDENVHPGRSHFHARYAGEEATYDIEALKPIAGRIPRRVNPLVIKWAGLHRAELRQNWRRARREDPADPPVLIDPLP
jgi:hypothetical protein